MTRKERIKKRKTEAEIKGKFPDDVKKLLFLVLNKLVYKTNLAPNFNQIISLLQSLFYEGTFRITKKLKGKNLRGPQQLRQRHFSTFEGTFQRPQ